MKIQWKRFPWVTVVLGACAILVGVGFNFFLQVCLPSYKSTVVTVSDVPEINQLLYVEDTDELVVYPWDQLALDDGKTVQEFLKALDEYDEHREEYTEQAKWLHSDLDAKMNGLFITSQAGVESWPDFLSQLRWYQDEGEREPLWLAMKGVPVHTSEGYDCQVDAAWSETLESCVYFHVYKKDPDPLLDSTVESANRYLDHIFEKNWTDPFPNGIYNGEFEKELEEQYDPILIWLSYVRDYTPLDAELLALTIRSEKCERIVYRDEILLVFSYDSQHRLVLFYDPFRNRITGFSQNL